MSSKSVLHKIYTIDACFILEKVIIVIVIITEIISPIIFYRIKITFTIKRIKIAFLQILL